MCRKYTLFGAGKCASGMRSRHFGRWPRGASVEIGQFRSAPLSAHNRRRTPNTTSNFPNRTYRSRKDCGLFHPLKSSSEVTT